LSPNDEDDARLVADLIRGDPLARCALFERYGAHVQKVLTRLLGYREIERADILHDVFIRAFERIADLREPRSLKRWLTGIAVLTTQEWFRSKRRSGPPQSPSPTDERLATPLEPEAVEGVRAFYSMMDRFQDDERSAFILRFVEGMKLHEVAEACDVSLSTARRRIERAENRFREMLPEYPALLERLTERMK
jgi:RNA polymerase sigma-70 factor (ECF subfamily)